MNRSANKLIKHMQEKKRTLALAESMTCGMAAFKLSNAVGTANVLKGSIVCYTPEIKMTVLRIPRSVIKKYSCESRQVTELLAKNLKHLLKADVYAAITGLASIGGSETKEKPVGTVFFTVLTNNKMHNYKKCFKGTPLEIKTKSCNELFKLILKHV